LDLYRSTKNETKLFLFPDRGTFLCRCAGEGSSGVSNRGSSRRTRRCGRRPGESLGAPGSQGASPRPASDVSSLAMQRPICHKSRKAESIRSIVKRIEPHRRGFLCSLYLQAWTARRCRSLWVPVAQGWQPKGDFPEWRLGSTNIGETLMKYRVIIERDEDGMFVAEVPALPGCISQGETRAEALRNIQEAIEVYIESLKAHNEPIPPSIDEEFVEVAM